MEIEATLRASVAFTRWIVAVVLLLPLVLGVPLALWLDRWARIYPAEGTTAALAWIGNLGMVAITAAFLVATRRVRETGVIDRYAAISLAVHPAPWTVLGLAVLFLAA